MATWVTGLDVLADLDMLSEFSAGCNYAKDIPIVSYSSYGRGGVMEEKNPTPPPSPLFNMMGETYVQPPLSFEPGAGRGERILALNRNREDVSLQRQLRMAMGPGYSNELIEEFIRGESLSDHSSEVGQFDDAQETNPAYEATQDATDSTEIISISTSSSAQSVTLENTHILTPTIDVKPKKKSPRRNRNALLNSLANSNAGSATESSNKNESKTSSPIRDYSSEITSATTNNIYDGFKNEMEASLPAHVSGINIDDIPACIRKTDLSFKMRDEDFPPL